MATTKRLDDTTVISAVVDVKVDIRQLIEDALDRRFPDSEAATIMIDWDTFMDREVTLDDFWVAVKVELAPI